MPNAAPNWHGQLVANTAVTINLQADRSEYQVINMDGSAIVDFTTDGTTPVVGGSPTGRRLASIAGYDDIVNVNPEVVGTIILISSATPHVSVQSIAGPEQG